MNITESPKFAQLCRDYLGHCKTELDTIRPAVAQKDFATIHSVGHKIKGTAGAYQLTEISQAARVLQETADNQDTVHLAQAFDTLYSLVDNGLQH